MVAKAFCRASAGMISGQCWISFSSRNTVGHLVNKARGFALVGFSFLVSPNQS